MIKIEMIFPGKGKIDDKEIDITEYEFTNFLKHNMIRFGPLWHIIQSADETRYFHVMMIMSIDQLSSLTAMDRYVEEFGTESVILISTNLSGTCTSNLL